MHWNEGFFGENKGLLKIYHSRSTKKRKSLYNFAVFSLCWCSTFHAGFTMVPFAISTSAHPQAEMESIVGIAMLQDSSHRCNKFAQIHQGTKKPWKTPKGGGNQWRVCSKLVKKTTEMELLSTKRNLMMD